VTPLPDANTALILRANYEEATRILSAYMQLVVNEANSRGLNVIDLDGYSATKTNFFDNIQLYDPLLVICAGHGNENGFYSQNDENVLTACTNDQIMSGREGIFNSCSVGVVLGPSMVTKGARWFVGWRADYLFMYDPETSDPLQDIYARPFMECIIQPALTRLRTNNLNVIYNETKNLFNSKISEWWNSNDPLAQDMITLLIHDRDNYMVTGESESVPAALASNMVPVLIIGGLVASHFIFKFP
jgi:hypothetical protein